MQTKIRLNINPVFFKIERAKTEENIDKSLMDGMKCRKVPYMLQKKHKMVAGRILGFSCRVGP